MQLFNRKAGSAEPEVVGSAVERPASVPPVETVLAAIAAAKPAALVKVEAKVMQLRESRSALSAELSKVMPAAREQISRHGKRPLEVAALERKIESLDQEIREARCEMHRRRQEFVDGEFARVAGEFKAQAAAEIRKYMLGLTKPFEILAALDHAAMRNGVEYRSGSAEVGAALQVLNRNSIG